LIILIDTRCVFYAIKIRELGDLISHHPFAFYQCPFRSDETTGLINERNVLTWRISYKH